MNPVNPVPSVTLNDGNTVPQLGYGVYKIKPENAVAVVTSARETGYRHIDTAAMYGNKRGVGEAVRASGLDRRETFATSKLDNGFHEPEAARRAFEGTLAKLGLGYADLFLIHWPLPTRYGGDFVSTWRTLTEFYREGRARSVGVSNFQVAHLERLAAETNLVPAVNQIEVHSYFNNDALRAYGQAHGIVTEAWSPLARGVVLSDPVVTEIAERTGKTAGRSCSGGIFSAATWSFRSRLRRPG